MISTAVLEAAQQSGVLVMTLGLRKLAKLAVMMTVGLSLSLAVSACGRKGPVEPPALTNS